MRTTISRHPLVSFFGMAFLFTWLAVIPLLLNPSLPVQPFQILGALAGPTLSAVVVIAATQGRSGLKGFFKRYIQWREGLGWWLFVLFGILIALTLVASAILGISVLGQFIQKIMAILPLYFLTLVVGMILGPLWEEPGWRGFALPRLQERFGPLPGTVILGVLWAAWHAPGYPGGWLQGSILALLAGSIAFSIIMTWVYNNTHGSILLMILLHSASNAAISVGTQVLPADLPPAITSFVFSGWIPAVTYAIIALPVVVFTRGRLSYPKSIPESQAAPRPAISRDVAGPANPS
jgi:membrane protease YdiL (CAAX protease family)